MGILGWETAKAKAREGVEGQRSSQPGHRRVGVRGKEGRGPEDEADKAGRGWVMRAF